MKKPTPDALKSARSKTGSLSSIKCVRKLKRACTTFSRHYPMFHMKAFQSERKNPTTSKFVVGAHHLLLHSNPRITWTSATHWEFWTSNAQRKLLQPVLQS